MSDRVHVYIKSFTCKESSLLLRSYDVCEREKKTKGNHLHDPGIFSSSRLCFSLPQWVLEPVLFSTPLVTRGGDMLLIQFILFLSQNLQG